MTASRDRAIPATRNAWIAASAAFLLFIAIARIRGLDQGKFRIDEAHKISETHFLRLLVRGDFSSPEWFRSIVDRTNPPVGKYLFGVAIVLAGLPLPEAPSLATHAVDGLIPKDFPPHVTAPYSPYLAVCRRAALIATALTAALLVWCAMRLSGVLAATFAFAWFTAHDLTRAFGATAIFDSSLALVAIAVVPPMWFLWRDPESGHRWVAAVAAGLICGLGLTLRMSGGIALLFCIVALLVAFIRRRSRAPLIAAVVIGVTAVTVAIASNPYYWAPAPNAPGVGAEFRADEPLPLRIAHRFEYQLRDLRHIEKGLDGYGLVMRSPIRRVRFFGLVMFGDLSGLVLWLGVTAGVILPILRRRVHDGHRLIALWALVVVGGIALWIPLPWHRYLLITLPPLALIAGVGTAEATKLLSRTKPQ